ncbi:unnamed protein product [Schistosoma turkestanicum]|nr:unnamed protein product [Schistosoma turkestanicum]
MSSIRSNRSTPTSRTSANNTTSTTTTTTTLHSYQHPNYLDKESLAATKIQAGYRGYCTRKKYGNLTLNSSSSRNSSSLSPNNNNNNYNLYADRKSHTTTTNTTTELDNAATRIQASYRGYLTRKALRDHDNHDDNDERMLKSNEQKLNYFSIDDHHHHHRGNDEDFDGKIKAVTKIQAGYRGYKTRKSLAPLLHHHHHQDGQNKENHNYARYKINHPHPHHHPHHNYNQERKFSSNSSCCFINDPELAATKIQATFRGYRTRRHLPK